MPAAPAAPAAADTLLRAAIEYGTPAYVYDLGRVRAAAACLRSALPPEVRVRYSVKANPAGEVCRAIAEAGLGAEVSSAGELRTAIEAGFAAERILVSGPYKEPELLARLAGMPAALISVDSVSELAQLAAAPSGRRHPVLLRLRPDYPVPGQMPAGPAPRFGIPLAELPAAAPLLRQLRCAGFHVHGGSQILDPAQAARQLHDASALAVRAAGLLGLTPAMLNLGGGFGVPCSPGDGGLDLGPAASTLMSMISGFPGVAVTLELGRYLVAEAGWYLTAVVHRQSHGDGPAVVVDGGVHHRPDLCGLGLACHGAGPALLGSHRPGQAAVDGRARGLRVATAVLGCLCLPSDVLAYAAELPELHAGDILAFPSAGAYGLTAAPAAFLGHRLPAEISMDGGKLALLPPPRLLPPAPWQRAPSRSRQPRQALRAGRP